MYFNQVTTSENARIELARMISLFSNSSIPAYNLFSNTLINWFDEIVNSFTVINGKRLSNGKIESINSRVKIILKNANGYKNFSRFRNRMIYSLNKDSIPSTYSNQEIIKKTGRKRGSYKTKIK